MPFAAGKTRSVAKGGKREGAGRKPSSNPTKPRVFRLTEDQYELVKEFVAQLRGKSKKGA